MKWIKIILIAFLTASCASPRLTTYEGQKVSKGKGVVIECRLISGEQFEFDNPGASLVKKDKMFFGKTPAHDFITCAYDSRQKLFDDQNQLIAVPDSSIRVYKIIQPYGETIEFINPGARYYASSLFITGPTMNGSPVLLPIDQVVQSENLRNLAALKRQAGFVTVLTFFGCIGLLTLYTIAKIEEGR